MKKDYVLDLEASIRETENATDTLLERGKPNRKKGEICNDTFDYQYLDPKPHTKILATFSDVSTSP